MIETNNVVIISDIHGGCRLGLYPPEPVLMDEAPEGGWSQTPFQARLWEFWTYFWDKWVPEATKKEKYSVIFNGDALDGVHHNAVHQITHNLSDQANIAEAVLRPVVARCDGRYFHIRGTEAHVGASGQEEERLARRIGAMPDEEGRHARYDIWKQIGPSLIHTLHHIGTTGSQAYELTALGKEMSEEFGEAAAWGQKIPDVIVRSHRHRYSLGERPTYHGRAISVVTPGWQGKTPFVWKIPGGRLSQPQFGGILVRHAHGRTFVDAYVQTITRSAVE